MSLKERLQRWADISHSSRALQGIPGCCLIPVLQGVLQTQILRKKQMKGFVAGLAFMCLLSVSAVAGDIPRSDFAPPVPGDIQMPGVASPAPGDMPTSGSPAEA